MYLRLYICIFPLEGALFSARFTQNLAARKEYSKTMKYRMLVLDIDGTLVNSQKEITPDTLNALLALQEQGFYVVIATGRPTAGVRKVAETLELSKYGNYIISYNGSRIVDAADNSIIYNREIPSALIPEIYSAAMAEGIGMMTYEVGSDGLENVISATPIDGYERLEARINDIDISQVDNFLSYVNFPINKVLMTGDGDKLEKVEKKFAEKFKGCLNVFRSEPFFLEITPLGVDKATTIDALLKQLSLNKDQIICCGDGFNDITMIKYAGLGVAMENAQEKVKKAANYITASNDDDGVLKVINKFILEKVG